MVEEIAQEREVDDRSTEREMEEIITQFTHATRHTEIMVGHYLKEHRVRVALVESGVVYVVCMAGHAALGAS